MAEVVIGFTPILSYAFAIAFLLTSNFESTDEPDAAHLSHSLAPLAHLETSPFSLGRLARRLPRRERV